MSDTKHTPGPWHVTENDGEYSINWPDCVGIKPFKDERRKANAYLIAAAPEMLEALKQVVSKVEKEYSIDFTDIPLVKAAILKAEGK